jgi:hypothetical protein
MDAKAECLHFDRLEIRNRSALQSFDAARREAEFDTSRQPHDDTVAAGVVMRALGPRPEHPRLPQCLGRGKFRFCQLSHETASKPPELGLMVFDQPQDPARFVLATADRLPDFWSDQIDHDRRSGPEHVDMIRGMVVGIDHDPETADAQNGRHDRPGRGT